VELVFSRPATHDLNSIIDYIALDNPTAAEKVYRTIMTSVEGLLEFPHVGHVGRVSGTRELSIQSFPYIAVYRVEPGVVAILAVFHAARDLARAMRERIGTRS
jgi:toxin ParE1/3/4